MTNPGEALRRPRLKSAGRAWPVVFEKSEAKICVPARV
jgi:hypothetical protein